MICESITLANVKVVACRSTDRAFDFADEEAGEENAGGGTVAEVETLATESAELEVSAA